MSSRQTPGARSKATSMDAILDAAEALFGRYGPEGVSLRQIGVAAGSANNSAVQYYFHSREGLIRGIFQRRLESLEQRRSAILAEARQAGLLEDPRTLLGIILLPIAEERNSAGQCSFAAFLLGLRLFGDISSRAEFDVLAPVTRTLHDALRSSLGGIPENRFRMGLLAAVSLFLVAVVDWDRRVASGTDTWDLTRDEFLDSILDMAVAALLAT